MYHELIFRPLYNGLVYLMDILPWIDVGIAVVIFTIIIKFILYPLSKSSLLTQVRMKEIEPEVNRLKAQYSADKQTQALKVMQLYKEKKIKPFAGVLLIAIQLPILLALISVFYKIIPTIDASQLYSFVSVPLIKTSFLGFIDLTQKSLVLSILTGIIQFAQLHFSLSSRPPVLEREAGKGDFSTQLATNMSKQMKFLVPLIAFASTYWLIPARFPQAAAIIAIYWSVSSLFTLAQELIIRKRYARQSAKVAIQ
ncbi:MAG: YidC/Oxa1 family membrane protein insertase [Patescibacteria group bacterium]